MNEIDDFAALREFLATADEAEKAYEEEFDSDGLLDQGLLDSAFKTLSKRIERIPRDRRCPSCRTFVYDYRSWIFPYTTVVSPICRSCAQTGRKRALKKEIVCKCILEYGVSAELINYRDFSALINTYKLYGTRGARKLKIPVTTWQAITSGRTSVVKTSGYVANLIDYLGSRWYSRLFQVVTVDCAALKLGMERAKLPVRRFAEILEQERKNVVRRLANEKTVFDDKQWSLIEEAASGYNLRLVSSDFRSPFIAPTAKK